MEIIDQGGIKLNFWGLWKGTLSSEELEDEMVASGPIVLADMEFINEHLFEDTAEFHDAYDHNMSRFYPKFK
jgi:hypothetical protein